jgi:type I restriction enzyme, S subunit
MKKNWHTKRIGEVCSLMTGGTPSKEKPEYFGGAIKWLVSGDIHQGEIFDCEGSITEAGMKNSNAKLLPLNSVMIALNGQGKTRGTVALLRTKATCNQSLVSICPKEPEKLLPEFLYSYLHGRYKEIRQMTGDSGNDRRGLNMDIIRSIEIPIAPPPEQRRIVGILNEAFEGIATAKANAERNLQNARALFESHLQSVFTQRGTGWVDTTIGEAIRFIDYRGKTPVKTASGIRLITAKNVKMGYVQETPAEYIAPANYKSWMTRGIPQRGDVLFTTEAPLANVAQLDTEEKVAFAQRIIIMQPDKARLDSTFLKYLLLSGPAQQRIRAEGTGATVQGIKASLLKLVGISFPKNLVEQRQIVNKLNLLDEEARRLAAIYEQKLAALEALKKSLLHQAFTGAL